MSFEIPSDRRYIESHEWAFEEDDVVRIGISDFAQDELGDVVFVELPESGATVDPEEPFGVIESIKAVSDLYSPIGGTVVDVNEDLFDAPELVNDDPYGDGWMIAIEPADASAIDALLTAEEYETQIA